MCNDSILFWVCVVQKYFKFTSNFNCCFELFNRSSQDLPPAENPSFALEQILLNPFKTTLNQALTCGQLISSRGFKYERHFVTTEDGYILQLYRIINPYARAARGRNLKPILMLHGAPTSCSSFMINGSGGHIKEWVNGNPPPDSSKSLAFALANREFDIWLGNSRGTTYSLNHTRLNPRRGRFIIQFNRTFLFTNQNSLSCYSQKSSFNKTTIININFKFNVAFFRS